MIISVIMIVLVSMSTSNMNQATRELKRAEEDRAQERARQYSEVLPIDVSMSVRVSDGQELKIGAIGTGETSIKPYRHAILRWENSEGSFMSVIHEKELETKNPAWFKALMDANGGSITLNNKECSPPYRIHTWPKEMRN